MYLETGYEETTTKSEEEKATKYAVIYFTGEEDDTANTDCLGIYDDYYKALGVAMQNIFEFVSDKDPNEYLINSPEELEDEAGEIITVPYEKKAIGDEYEKTYKIYIYFVKSNLF